MMGFAAIVAMLVSGTALAGEAAKAVEIELDGHPTVVYVEEYNVGIDTCTAYVRPGERIRIVPNKGPRRSDLTWRMEYRQKSHMVCEEEAAFPLVYRYAGEDRLQFARDGKRWFKVEGDKKTLVGVSVFEKKGKVDVRLKAEEVAGLPYVYVRASAPQVPAVVPLLKDVKSVGLHIPYVTVASLEALKGMTNLTLLHIYGPHENHGRSPSTLESVAPLAGLTSLEILNMEGSVKVTDISPLGSLTSLKVLELSNCDTLKDISVLGQLKNLTCLSLPPATTDEQLAKVCEEHPGLITLEVRYAENLKSIVPLAGLASLERLSLLFSGPVADMTPLSSLKNLRSFGMPRAPKPDEGLAAACKALPDLRVLSITGSAVTDLSPVASCKSLEVLHRGRVPRNRRGLKGLEGVKDLKELRYIRLYNSRIADLTPLSNLTKLKAIAMTKSSVVDCTALKNLTDIEFLCFYGSKTFKSFDGVQNMKKLVRCSMRGCNNLEDLSALEQTPLEYIYLLDCRKIDITPLTKIKTLKRVLGVSKEHLAAIRKAVPGVRGRR
jgi:Leucine-rich repeat (LRR) protein